MQTKTVFSAYNRPKSKGIECTEPTLTQQHFANEVDINNIVERYQRTGLLVDPREINESRKAIYGDFTNAGDFYSAQESIIKAQDAFMQLPPQLRLRFQNDPAQLIGFLDNPANIAEAVTLGLVENPLIAVPPKTEPPKATEGASTISPT